MRVSKYMRSVARILGLGILLLTLSCRKSPVEPNEKPVKNTLHGIWTNTYSSPYYYYRKYMSFNTATGDFRWLGEGGYQFYYESVGKFTANSFKITTDEQGYAYSEWYSFLGDTLVTSYDSLFSSPGRYVLTQSTPKADSWVQHVVATSVRPVYGFDLWTSGLAVSDSGLFLFTSNSDSAYVTRFDSTLQVLSTTRIDYCSGIDAEGPYVWTATKTIIEKRTLPNMSVVQTVVLDTNIIGIDWPDFTMSGFARDDNSIYLSGYLVSNDYRGIIFRFDSLGRMEDFEFTNNSIRDLEVNDHRLFVVNGTSNFYEVNDRSGEAIHTYHVDQIQADARIRGIAYHKNVLYLYGPGIFTSDLPPGEDASLLKKKRF